MYGETITLVCIIWLHLYYVMILKYGIITIGTGILQSIVWTE